jgi:hypothetical protein
LKVERDDEGWRGGSGKYAAGSLTLAIYLLHFEYSLKSLGSLR